MKYIFSKMFNSVIRNSCGYDTEKEALLMYYKEQEFLIRDRIRKSKENIAKNERELDKLHERFAELRESSPEEFI